MSDVSDDIIARIEALERSVQQPLDLSQLPLGDLQRHLENNWQPDATMLQPHSITSDQIAVGAAVPPPLRAEVTVFEGTNNTGYTDLTTAGPSIIVPAAGLYDVVVEAYMRSNTVGFSALMGFAVGATAASDGNAARFDAAGVSIGNNISRHSRVTANAGDAITAKYRASGGTASFGSRVLLVTRVG